MMRKSCTAPFGESAGASVCMRMAFGRSLALTVNSEASGGVSYMQPTKMTEGSR